MNTWDRTIREAVKSGFGGDVSCVGVDELAAFYDGGLVGAEAERIRSHLASCPKCLELARDYCDFAGVEFPRETGGRVFRLFSGERLRAVAAGIALFAVLGVVWSLQPGVPRQDAIRNAADRMAAELVSPAGDVAAPPASLEWSFPGVGVRYEVELRDSRFAVLWRATDLEDEAVTIPPDVTGRLDAGQEYAWRVTVVMPDGRRLQSPFRSFRIVER